MLDQTSSTNIAAPTAKMYNVPGFTIRDVPIALTAMTVCCHRSPNPSHHSPNFAFPAWHFLDWKLEGPKESDRCIQCRISNRMQNQSLKLSDKVEEQREEYSDIHRKKVRDSALEKLKSWREGMYEKHYIQVPDMTSLACKCSRPHLIVSILHIASDHVHRQ